LFWGTGVFEAGVDDLPGFSGSSIGGSVEFCAGGCSGCAVCCCAASGSAAALNKKIKLQTVAR
jgi:hypothetical protein